MTPTRRGDHRLQGTEAEALQAENDDGRDCRQDHAEPQRDPEEQGKPERGSEELGQVRGHGGYLRHDPHHDHEPSGQALAAVLRKVLSRGNPQLRREGLQQHCHEVCRKDDPEEHETELGASLNVGGEIARDPCRRRTQ